MATAYPGPYNVFVLSHEATGGLIAGFSRNPKKFKLNRWAKLIPVSMTAGYFLQITAEEAARVINTNLADFVWGDGQEAPMGNDNLESFQFQKYLTTRYCFPFNMGNKTIAGAVTWPILSVMSGFAAQKCMTARSVSGLVLLTTTGNWGSSTGTATALGGGVWNTSGATDKFIRKTFNQVSENILQATNAVVNRDEMICVINPHDARLCAESEELRDYLKQSPFAMSEVRMDKESQNGEWGLPSKLWGIDIVVEDCVRVTSRKLATRTTSYCLPSGNAIFVSRPGGLVGMEGIPEFSTFQYFMYEEMSVETLNDISNRRTLGRCVDDYANNIVASAAGYLATSTTNV